MMKWVVDAYEQLCVFGGCAIGVVIVVNAILSLFVLCCKIGIKDFDFSIKSVFAMLLTLFPFWLHIRAVVLKRIELAQGLDPDLLKERNEQKDERRCSNVFLIGLISFLCVCFVSPLAFDHNNVICAAIGIVSFFCCIVCAVYAIPMCLRMIKADVRSDALRPFGKCADSVSLLEKSRSELSDWWELKYLEWHPELKDKCPEYRDYFNRETDNKTVAGDKPKSGRFANGVKDCLANVFDAAYSIRVEAGI